MSTESLAKILAEALETPGGPELMTAMLSKHITRQAERHPDLNPYPGRFEFTDAQAFLHAVKKQPTPNEATERAHAFTGDPTR